MNTMQDNKIGEQSGSAEFFDTIVIGGGQAGLAMGYHLTRQGRDFVILDERERVGDAWRQRWDSLRLFTPAKFNGLPGTRFPGDRLSFPTKDEQADYLEMYAGEHGLLVRAGMRVDRLWQEGDSFLVTSGHSRLAADHVVIATGPSHTPRVPEFASDLSPSVFQLHSHDYRGPQQLQAGDVLVVGVGNSGAEIALELSRTHRTLLAGKESAEIPMRHGRAAARFGLPVVRFLGMHVLTLNTPIGRKVAPGFTAHATPLIRTKRKDLAAAGVESVGRVVGVREGLPVVGGEQALEGDQTVDVSNAVDVSNVLDVSNVVWCTGFRDDFSWVDLPAFDENSRPIHHRGVVPSVPGLYFLGREFQFAAVSATLPGVGRDAAYIAGNIASARLNGSDRRPPSRTPTAPLVNQRST